MHSCCVAWVLFQFFHLKMDTWIFFWLYIDPTYISAHLAAFLLILHRLSLSLGSPSGIYHEATHFSRLLRKQSWAKTSLWKSQLWVWWFAKGMEAFQTGLPLLAGYSKAETDTDFHKVRHRRRERNGEHLAITILVGSGMLALILSGCIPAQHSSNENLAGWLVDWLSH